MFWEQYICSFSSLSPRPPPKGGSSVSRTKAAKPSGHKDLGEVAYA